MRRENRRTASYPVLFTPAAFACMESTSVRLPSPRSTDLGAGPAAASAKITPSSRRYCWRQSKAARFDGVIPSHLVLDMRVGYRSWKRYERGTGHEER